MAARSAIRPFLGMGRYAVFGRMSSGARFGVVMRGFRARFSVMVRRFSVMVVMMVMVMVGRIPVPFQQCINHHLARGEE